MGKAILAVFIGGGMGSVARYLIGKMVLSITQSAFPWGTLTANVLSCLVLGMVLAFWTKLDRPDYFIPLVVIGFCGGFSTFSTFSYETLLLMQAGKWSYAFVNVGLSFAGCILVLFALSRVYK